MFDNPENHTLNHLVIDSMTPSVVWCIVFIQMSMCLFVDIVINNTIPSKILCYIINNNIIFSKNTNEITMNFISYYISIFIAIFGNIIATNKFVD